MEVCQLLALAMQLFFHSALCFIRFQGIEKDVIIMKKKSKDSQINRYTVQF